MPRIARIKAEFCTYHIIQRGNERKNLFLSDRDKQRFIETLIKTKEKYNFLLYAYCLMNNHVHLLLSDNGNDISEIMKSLNIRYAVYFNRKYERCGHLFQDRFKSELIQDERYLLTVSKYIHNNPVNAKLVKRPDDYKWSSYNIYIGKEENYQDFVDTNLVLGQASNSYKTAVSEYVRYVNSIDENKPMIMDTEDDFNNINSENRTIHTIDKAREKIMSDLRIENVSIEGLLRDKKKRDETVREIRRNSTLTLKEIGELFGGMSESRISRILSNE